MLKKCTINALLLTPCVTITSGACTQATGPAAAAHSASTRIETPAVQKDAGRIRGQVMVRFRQQLSPAAAERILVDYNAGILTRYTDPRLFHIALPDGMSVDSGLALFQAMDEVEFAEPNLIYKTEE